MDLADPSPALGWAHEERASLTERAGADTLLALALVHHLAIGRNIPLERIATQLGKLAPQLIIEFVPRDDPMVRQLLATREDVFPDYTPDGFRGRLRDRVRDRRDRARRGLESGPPPAPPSPDGVRMSA